jgi:hypothetical protein
MMWDAMSVEGLIDKLCQDMDMYMWWAVNFWARVLGQEKWKIDIASRNKKPSDLLTILDEALALLLFENHVQSWKDKAESGCEGDKESETSSVMSDDSSKRYTRKHGSTKDGWSDEGIAHFGQLMAKVGEDCASTNGAEFPDKQLVQQKMKQESSNARGSRKQCHRMEENRIAMVENELPDMTDSDNK